MKQNDSTGDQRKETVLIGGAGVVGADVAILHLHAGFDVLLVDQSVDAIRKTTQRVRTEFCRDNQPTTRRSFQDETSKENVSTDQWWPDGHATFIRIANGSPAFNTVDDIQSLEKQVRLVIECVSEKLDVKQSFFKSAEERFGDEVIFATNTSTIQIDRIAESISEPGRLIGMHFFMPVGQRDGIELIAGRRTDDVVIAHSKQHIASLGKTTILAQDTPGFIVNRMLSPYLNEAILMLCEGVDADRIEAAAREYGMPISPLELADRIGLRTIFDAGRCFWQAFPNRIQPAPIVGKMIKRKRLGYAAGAGFYDYEAATTTTETTSNRIFRSSKISPELSPLIEEYQRETKILIYDNDVLDRLWVPMAIEASCLQDDGVVETTSAIDIAMAGGLGFRRNDESTWSQFVCEMGNQRGQQASDRFGSISASMAGWH